MKKQLRSFFINRLIKKTKAETNYEGWQDVKNVLLIFDGVDAKQIQKAENLKTVLQGEGKIVAELQFVSGKRPKENSLKNAYYGSETGLFSQPKKRVFNDLTNPTDVLIYWSGLLKSPNDFLALRTEAKLKIGVNKQLPCFDLTVSETEGNDAEITKEIVKYLKIINK